MLTKTIVVPGLVDLRVKWWQQPVNNYLQCRVLNAVIQEGRRLWSKERPHWVKAFKLRLQGCTVLSKVVCVCKCPRRWEQGEQRGMLRMKPRSWDWPLTPGTHAGPVRKEMMRNETPEANRGPILRGLCNHGEECGLSGGGAIETL